MEKVINFINNNAIVASLITLFMSTIIQVLFKISDRKYNEKCENIKERRKQFENKAEFIIFNDLEEETTIQKIELVMTDFKYQIIDHIPGVEFYYSNDILDSKKYKHLKFCLKNIGNADVNQLTLCATFKKNTMLCHVNDIDFYVKNKLVNYDYLFDRKIMRGNSIIIDIAYLPNSKICNMFSCEIALIFKDSYGNLYEQPFFIQKGNLYEPRLITYEEYNIYTKDDMAIECFKKPWMW